jgi:hypothetical protein
MALARSMRRHDYDMTLMFAGLHFLAARDGGVPYPSTPICEADTGPEHGWRPGLGKAAPTRLPHFRRLALGLEQADLLATVSSCLGGVISPWQLDQQLR